MEYDYEWAELLSICKLKGRVGDPNYDFTLGLIRSACDNAFDIEGNANCRLTTRSMAIRQTKYLQWNYLYRCIKMSKKDFIVMLPEGINSSAFKGVSDVYAWYNKKIDAIECLAYTGRIVVDEEPSPGYDGFGRFDKEYEIVQGAIDENGKWQVKPYKAFASLYEKPPLNKAR